LARIIAEVGQSVAEFVRKLKAILRPVSILSRQTDRYSTACGALEIDFRMIGSVVDIDTVKPDVLAMSPNFIGYGLQYRGDVTGTYPPKPLSLHSNIRRFRC
jgi:hypothetical protein